MSLGRRGFRTGSKMKIIMACTKAAALVLFCFLFAAGCTPADSHPEAAPIPFTIVASNVDLATVALAAGDNAATPTQAEAIVAIKFSPNGTAAFTDFVRSHTNLPVNILVDQYTNGVMFRGEFTNWLQGFDFHCASSNEAQRVAEILNKK